MADDDAIASGTGLEALVEAAKDGPEAEDSSDAPSEKAAGAKKSPAKPKKASPYLGWQEWTLDKFMEMFPLVDVDDKAFTVPMMKREHQLRGLGVCKSTQRPSAARWTEKVRRGEDPRAKKDRPKPAAAEGAAGAEDDSDLERDEYVKGGLTCHDYVRLAHCYN